MRDRRFVQSNGSFVCFWNNRLQPQRTMLINIFGSFSSAQSKALDPSGKKRQKSNEGQAHSESKKAVS